MSYIPALARNPIWPLNNIESPHINDILCGRGGGSQNHPGNDYYRRMISSSKYWYLSSNKREKREIALELVSRIYTLNPPGRFLEKNECTLRYNDIGEERAVAKVSQALREGAPNIRKRIEIESMHRQHTSFHCPNDSLFYSSIHNSTNSYISNPAGIRCNGMVANGRYDFEIQDRSPHLPGNGRDWAVLPPSPSSVRQPNWNEYPNNPPNYCFEGVPEVKSQCLNNELYENKGYVTAGHSDPVFQPSQQSENRYYFDHLPDDQELNNRSSDVTCCNVGPDGYSNSKQLCDDSEINFKNLMMHFRHEKPNLVISDISDRQQLPKTSITTLPTDITSTTSSSISEQEIRKNQGTNFNSMFDNIKTNEAFLLRQFNGEKDISSSNTERKMSTRSIETFPMDDEMSINDLDESDEVERFLNYLHSPESKETMEKPSKPRMNRRGVWGRSKSIDSMQISFSSIMSSTKSILQN